MEKKSHSQQVLENLFSNIFHELTVDNELPIAELTPELLAEEVLNAGFVYSMHGSMTADIIRHVAIEMRQRINSGDIAETVAFPEGTTGLQEAIDERDGIHEEPDTWLEEFADRIEKGEFYEG